jgi:hypothetical protein
VTTDHGHAGSQHAHRAATGWWRRPGRLPTSCATIPGSCWWSTG